MEKRTDLAIPYGLSDFRTIRYEGCYYVDKSEYIAKLEERDRFVFTARATEVRMMLDVSAAADGDEIGVNAIGTRPYVAE